MRSRREEGLGRGGGGVLLLSERSGATVLFSAGKHPRTIVAVLVVADRIGRKKRCGVVCVRAHVCVAEACSCHCYCLFLYMVVINIYRVPPSLQIQILCYGVFWKMI